MRQNLRGFAHLFVPLIFALIVFVGIGYYAYKNGQIKIVLPQKQTASTPTPKLNVASVDTELWSHYINTTYGFTIKYPINLYPKFVENSGYLWLTMFEEKSGYEHLVNSFSVSVNQNSLEEEVNFQKQQVEGHILKKLSKEGEIRLEGYQAIRLDYVPTKYEDEQNPSSTVIINNGKYSYSLVANTQNIEQILSTFGFLEPITIRSNWKTFEDEVTKIQISFPLGFSTKQEGMDLTVSDGKTSLYFHPEFQGSPCANAPCDQYKSITLNIAGVGVQTTQIYPDSKKNYTFKVVLPYPKPIGPYTSSLSIFGYYPNENDLELINQILSTLRFNSGK